MLSSKVVLAAALALAPVSAQGRNPGSVLVYPVHRSGPAYFTVVSVTNVNTAPKTKTAFGGGTQVHFQYVNVVANPANPFRPLGCSIFDRIQYLTPADTLSVLTACHDAFAPGGQEGYLVVDAEDPSLYRTPWSHNYLIGSELVLNAQGASYALEALPFASPLADGTPTDLDADGRLDFDGFEYARMPDFLYIDSFLALASSQLSLTNFTFLHPSDINTVLFSVWNDNEFPMSATLDFNCWFDQPLVAISMLFSDAFLKTLPNDPGELDVTGDMVGDLETGWALIQSLGVRTPGGLPVGGFFGVQEERLRFDGALLGCISTGPRTNLEGGRLLWESVATQPNGQF